MAKLQKIITWITKVMEKFPKNVNSWWLVERDQLQIRGPQNVCWDYQQKKNQTTHKSWSSFFWSRRRHKWIKEIMWQPCFNDRILGIAFSRWLRNVLIKKKKISKTFNTVLGWSIDDVYIGPKEENDFVKT